MEAKVILKHVKSVEELGERGPINPENKESSQVFRTSGWRFTMYDGAVLEITDDNVKGIETK